MFNKILKIVLALRISSLITGILVFLILQVNSNGTEWWVNALLAFSFYIGTGAGMVINDIFDFELDKSAGKKTYLTEKVVSIKEAWFSFIFLAVLSYIIQIGFYQNLEAFIVYILASVLVIAYTPIIKQRFSYLKAPFVALMSLSSLSYAILYVEKDIWMYLPVFVLAFFFIFARENISDYYDFEADSKNNIKTLHHFFNKEHLLYFSIFLLFVGGTLSYFFVETDLGKIFALINAVFVSVMIGLWYFKREKWILKRGNLVGVLIATLAIVFGF